MFGKSEKKLGEGIIFGLDNGKILINGLLIYYILFQNTP